MNSIKDLTFFAAKDALILFNMLLALAAGFSFVSKAVIISISENVYPLNLLSLTASAISCAKYRGSRRHPPASPSRLIIVRSFRSARAFALSHSLFEMFVHRYFSACSLVRTGPRLLSKDDVTRFVMD